MVQAASQEHIRSMIGDPKVVGRELRSFKRSARSLSSDHPRLIDKYEDEWVAVYRGNVVAHAKTLASMMRRLDALDKRRVPRRQIIVRFIARSPKTMIL